MTEETPIREIKGIGEKTEKLFEKLNIYTAGDLLRYYPRGYDVYDEPVPVSEVEEGKICTVTGAIFGRVQVAGNRRLPVTTLHVRDLTGTLKAVWFRMPFLRNAFAGGGAVTLRGRVVRKGRELVMEQPEIFYPPEKYEEKSGTLQPIYGLTKGLTNNGVSKAVGQVLKNLELSREVLPEDLRMRYGLAEYNYALRGIHFPEDKEVYFHARKRLVFEEFLAFILSLRRLKDSNQRMENNYVMDVDCVIMALGTSPNPILKKSTEGLATNKKGCIEADENGKTSIEGVYAGGDAVTGAATVILAMGAGKKAAAAIDEYLKNK